MADSVIGLADKLGDDRASFNSDLPTFAPIAQRLAGDFDAVTPPPDLARLHDQIVSSVKAIAQALVGLVPLQSYSACGTTPPAPGPCASTFDERIAASQLSQRFLRTLISEIPAYEEARERATRMLRVNAVVLPPRKGAH